MPRAEGENAASIAASAEFGRRVYLVDIAFLGRRWKGPEKRRTRRREGERSNRQLRWAATAGKDPETRSVSDSLHPRPLPRTAPFLSQARVVLLEGCLGLARRSRLHAFVRERNRFVLWTSSSDWSTRVRAVPGRVELWLRGWVTPSAVLGLSFELSLLVAILTEL